MEGPAGLTTLLNAASRGDAGAAELAARQTYEALYDIARAHRVSWRAAFTLDTGAILHEAYLKLFAGQLQQWEHRRHFYRAASCAMRHVLVDYARARRTAKRSPEGGLVDLDGANPVAPEVAQEILDVHASLPVLERAHPEHAQIVEMRYFLGLTQPEVAEALELSLSTVRRRETFALAFLRAEMLEPTRSHGEALR
jgi:RNA polymerase sigma factor (TIGR02999 family)